MGHSDHPPTDTSGASGAPASSADAQAAVVSALENQNAGTPSTSSVQTPTPSTGTTPAPAEPEGSGLASPFLDKADPADRPILEKYVKEWDGGVTKKFQELHGQLAPFQELGHDPDTLRTAVDLLQMIDTEPERVLSLLQEAIGQQGEGQQAAQGLEGQQQQGEPGADDWQSQLPPQFMKKFTKFEQVLEGLAGHFLTEQEKQTQAEEDKILDQTLDSIKSKHQGIDETFVMAMLSAGTDPDKIGEIWSGAIQGQVNTRAAVPNVPVILGGGGAAPQQVPDVRKASSAEVKGLVADILRRNAESAHT